MSGKQVVIDMSESVKNGTGKDMEQWFFRIVILYCLSGGDIDSIMGMVQMAPKSQYGVDAFAYWPNFGIGGWAGGVVILYFMYAMARRS